MTSVILGLLTALCWGWADVLARFTGRALGAQGSLFGMMLAGTAGLSLWIVVDGQAWPGLPSWWTIATALLAMTAMLLFYEAMRRGPVSLASPAVGAYPAWAVLISMAFGVVPPPAALAAMDHERMPLGQDPGHPPALAGHQLQPGDGLGGVMQHPEFALGPGEGLGGVVRGQPLGHGPALPALTLELEQAVAGAEPETLVRRPA